MSNHTSDLVRPLAIMLVVLATSCYCGAKESATGGIGGVSCNTPGLQQTNCFGGGNCQALMWRCRASFPGFNDQQCGAGQGDPVCANPCTPTNNDTAPAGCTPS
jgi:hypothetical protein